MKEEQIIECLKVLRDSADIMLKVFTCGSCYRLYMMLKAICPEAIPYWSDLDGHCITRIQDSYYDIGGKVSSKYALEKGYYPIPTEMQPGYELLKYHAKEEAKTGVIVQRYVS